MRRAMVGWALMAGCAAEAPPPPGAQDTALLQALDPGTDSPPPPRNPQDTAPPLEDLQPVVLSGETRCYPHTTGETDNIWTVSLLAEDPQGAKTLAPLVEGLELHDELEGRVLIYALACDPEGLCTGSWLDSDDGVHCDSAEFYTVRARVMDEDGHWSEPLVMAPIPEN